jgi:hypothetical protein
MQKRINCSVTHKCQLEVKLTVKLLYSKRMLLIAKCLFIIPDLLSLVMFSLTAFRPTTFWKLPTDHSMPSTTEILYSEYLDCSYSEMLLEAAYHLLNIGKSC